MDVRVGALTVSVVEPDTLPIVAVMLLVPLPTGVANPAAEIVATVVVCEAQVTWLVKSFVVLLLYVPVAVNCCVAVRLVIVGFAGVTAIEFSVGGGGVVPEQPAKIKTNNAENTIAAKRCACTNFITPPQNGST